MMLLLADNQPLFRTGLLRLLEDTFPHSQMHQQDSWRTVHQSLRRYQYNLILLDILMPREKDSWEQELGRLIQTYPKTPICVISALTEPTQLNSVFNSGVRGYICKTTGMSEIKTALLQIKQGKTYFASPFCDVHIQSDNMLTSRQQAILKLAADGKSNKLIATTLDVAENTVKRHIYNICQALQAKNRVEAIAVARQQGLLSGL